MRNLQIQKFFIYILASNTGTLYIGVTNDLIRRVFEHKNKLIEGFSKRYNITNLVYFQEFKYIDQAIEMEKKTKKWGRVKKINLIKSMNPEFQDLAKDFNLEISR